MTESRDPFWGTKERAREYDSFAKNDFSDVYPLVAEQILKRTNITKGRCLDIGCGPASLSVAVAKRSAFHITSLDVSPEMYEIAISNIRNEGLSDRITPVTGDVHRIPFCDSTFDLVISRGSYHFWDDFTLAVREICRVLKPGAKAYIGGGYGSPEIRDRVVASRKKRGIVDDPKRPARKRFKKFREGEIEESFCSAGVKNYIIINDDSGFWMIFSKNK
ncbi:ubiquinone/menaquinone biosynthesis C-methylase UbiE [Methanomicrobium sp. W14]|uniref:class I SAM-dependent methyltransferase n=1 Tax=Methanomicrobium sp. W14 TaxID=2817839 RepID=UPI001AE7E981|nr:class I SAM-dependent methyltransferase [Methanomicrobium sp. W14]MBP2134024.1 ubiquinone/menaquinone biosynthesis C-methylase UbiE [Methanomicrobium sp. W14]